MSGALNPQVANGLPIHAVWWQVLKPSLVVQANGQPSYEVAATCETLAEATARARNIPLGAIVCNMVVFVNPAVAVQAPKPQ